MEQVWKYTLSLNFPRRGKPIRTESAEPLSEQQAGTPHACHEQEVQETTEVLLSSKNFITDNQ